MATKDMIPSGHETVRLPPLWEKWGHLAAVGSIIECPKMTLWAGDHEPPIVVGAGQMIVQSTRGWTYEIKGVPDDVGHAMRSIRRLEFDPYDGRLRSRLTAVDSEGVDISMGWTEPVVQLAEVGPEWTFKGECDSAWLTEDPVKTSFTEDLFLLAPQHRSRTLFRRFFPRRSVDDDPVEHRLDVDGAEIVFALYDRADMLTITAEATEMLPLTYTENWLAEPLRIMFGQLLFPRIVVRRHEGQSMISIRPANRWDAESDACRLWDGAGEFTDAAGFWATYEALLRHIAGARDDRGQPNFEPNRITRFYDEVIQASGSSRWIWCLAHASAVEGVVSCLVPRGSSRPGADPAGVDDLCRHIDQWSGTNDHLRHVSKNAAKRTLETSTAHALRELCNRGDVTRDQYKAWDQLRNQVMHGGLISPYSSEEADKLLLDLAGLLHAVTRKLVSAPKSQAER